MDHVVRPSLDPRLVERRKYERVPKRIRRRSTAQLHQRLAKGVFEDTFNIMLVEFEIRDSMLRCFFDPHDNDYPHLRKPSVDTYREMKVVERDAPPLPPVGEPDFYEGHRDHDPRHRWYVSCRRESWPWSGALPQGFATREQADAAMAALQAAGLGSSAALHRRIKVERDWAGVRRVMLEAART